MARISTTVLFIVVLLFSPLCSADIEVLGLFKDAAYLRINGKERLVKAGTSFEGVQLLEANSRRAILVVGGEQRTVTMSQHISAAYTEVERAQVRIPSNRNRQYLTTARINGRAVTVLVDTGANVVAMNSATADSLAIKYRSNKPHSVETAGGLVKAFPVQLETVIIGNLTVSRVQASVLEGSYPTQVLLGMSYLEHVEMQEKDGILMLLQKY